MPRVGVPHTPTESCSPYPSGCACGWRVPCRVCDPLPISPTLHVCVVCGATTGSPVPSHPGQLPDCTPRASISQTVTVCSCGYRHPDWASLEWQAWLSERTS